jgi:hypothetical protein
MVPDGVLVGDVAHFSPEHVGARIMSRTTYVLALAGLLAGASLGAQPPAGAPPAGQPGQPGQPRARRPMSGRFQPGARPQQPGMPGMPGMAGPMGGIGGGSLASRLLASTGELKLTDQQVVRLAAIARREADQRQTLRVRMDSLRTRLRADTTARRRAFTDNQADFQRLRDQARTDVRDALAVLTPDQQAQAWEMPGLRGGGGARFGPAAMRRRR